MSAQHVAVTSASSDSTMHHDSVEVASFFEPTVNKCVDTIRSFVKSVNERINVRTLMLRMTNFG